MALKDLIRRGLSDRHVTRREDEHPFVALQREMNRLIDDLSRGWTDAMGLGMTPYTSAMGLSEQTGGAFSPRVDVTESSSAVEVSAELPGVSEKDLDLSLSTAGDVLTLRGEKKLERERRGGGDGYYMERYHGAFYRDIPLPAVVDADRAEATFKNGVLTVRLQKQREDARDVKKIAVKTSA